MITSIRLANDYTETYKNLLYLAHIHPEIRELQSIIESLPSPTQYTKLLNTEIKYDYISQNYHKGIQNIELPCRLEDNVAAFNSLDSELKKEWIKYIDSNPSNSNSSIYDWLYDNYIDDYRRIMGDY